MNDGIIDQLLRSARNAEQYAIRCYTAAKTMGWTGTHNSGANIRAAKVAQSKLKRKLTAHAQTGRPLLSPTEGAYGALWPVALEHADGFKSRDLVSPSVSIHRACGAISTWRGKKWIIYLPDGSYVVAPHMRPNVAEVPTVEGESVTA